MRNYIATLAVIIFVLTFLGNANANREVSRKELVAVGPSEKAFKKNQPQNYCEIFKNGGSREGVKLGQANGAQLFTGVCSNTPQGEIPKVNKMPSVLILSPRNNQKIKKGKPFNVVVKVSNLQTGFFSDPITTYNAFPQKLNDNGVIQGHSHVTIQFLGKHGDEFPDAEIFEFFKGLNEPAQKGLLEVEAQDGLKYKGIYRICTMSSSFSHQPLVLPKAQRGSSDDCIRVEVV